MQESVLDFKIQSAYELNTEPSPSTKLINYSSSAKMLAPSSTQFLQSGSIKTYSSQNFGNESGFKKCVRRGDKIYKVDAENINMFENKMKGKHRKSSSEVQAQLEKINSGESLYKTFSFEQSTNDDDTEKCIAFWRSVMEKNLAPIKCSIIEQAQSTPSLKSDVSTTSRESLRSEIVRLHDDYKNLVQSVLKDLQKKRLHEIKMYGARCRLCESLSSSVGTDSDKDVSTELDVIAELDEWTPESKKKEKSKRMSITDSAIDVAARENAEKEEASKFKLVDVIDEKTKTGAYTAWRRNKVEEPCPCGNLNCDCNTNPAIISVKVKGSGSGDSAESQSETNSTSTEDKSSASSELRSEDVSEDVKDGDKNIVYLGSSIKNVHECMSFVVHCECGTPDCTCHDMKVTVSREKLTERESHQVIGPTAVSNVTVISSFEISRETIQETPRAILTDREESKGENPSKIETCQTDDSKKCEDDIVKNETCTMEECL